MLEELYQILTGKRWGTLQLSGRGVGVWGCDSVQIFALEGEPRFVV